MALVDEHFRILGALYLFGPATIPALANRLGLSPSSVETRVRALRSQGYLLDGGVRGQDKNYSLLWHQVQKHPELVAAVERIIRRHKRRERLTELRNIIHRRTSVRT